MELRIYAVKDRATDAYAQPMFLQTNNQAIRLFQDEVNRAAPDNALNKHPDDYDLYYIGKWENESALLTPTERPELIMRGKDAYIKGE